MINRDEALSILQKNLKNENLKRHCLAVEAVMRGLSQKFSENEDLWGIAGLLHDADYEIVKNDIQNHTKLTVSWIENISKDSKELLDAILAHAWGYVNDAPMPKNNLEWSLYCCDELTGLIVAVALVKPDKKLNSVSLDSVLSKWNQKSFAKGVDRSQIEKCEEKLGIKKEEFIEIALNSMKKIANELGL